jgi:hypothetical protein
VSMDNGSIEHIFYVQPDIRKYRSIKDIDDYLRIRTRAHRSAIQVGRTGRMHALRKPFPGNDRLNAITAYGTIVIAIVAIATLVVILLQI